MSRVKRGRDDPHGDGDEVPDLFSWMDADAPVGNADAPVGNADEEPHSGSEAAPMSETAQQDSESESGNESDSDESSNVSNLLASSDEDADGSNDDDPAAWRRRGVRASRINDESDEDEKDTWRSRPKVAYSDDDEDDSEDEKSNAGDGKSASDALRHHEGNQHPMCVSNLSKHLSVMKSETYVDLISNLHGMPFFFVSKADELGFSAVTKQQILCLTHLLKSDVPKSAIADYPGNHRRMSTLCVTYCVKLLGTITDYVSQVSRRSGRLVASARLQSSNAC